MPRLGPFFLLMLAVLAPVAAPAAFTNIPWVINGAAQKNVPGRVVLTQNSGGQNASAFNPCALNLNSDFDLSFAINLGTRACGADGIAFVVQNNSPSQVGGNAGAHAYDGFSQSFAVQFDTWSNVVAPYNDPVYDSIGLQTGGNIQDAGPAACGGTGYASGTCGRPATSATQFNMKDGLDHAVDIHWVAATRTLSVVVDGSTRAAWTFPASYQADLFGGGSSAWYGFTASTGGSYNYQQIAQTSPDIGACAATATPTQMATATPLVVPTNDCGTPTNMPTFTNTPTITLTPSASPSFTVSPTPFPPGCGAPVFQDARLIGSGCIGGGPSFSFPYALALAANQVLIIRFETTQNSNLPTSVQFGGVPMTLHSSGTTGYSNSRLHTFYLANPPSGSLNLTFNHVGGNCNWNIAAELYRNVNTAAPLGTYASTVAGTGDGTTGYFGLTVTTVSDASMVSVYMASEQVCNAGDVPLLGPLQVSHDLRTTGVGMACCECVFGDHKEFTGAGPHLMTYDLAQNNRQYYAQAIEVRGASCDSPTPTPTSQITDTFTPSPTRTNTLPPPSYTFTPTSTSSFSATLTFSSTYTVTLGPSPTPSLTPTASPTSSNSPSPSATATPSSTWTLSFTPSHTPTASHTASLTPTWSASPTASNTPSATFTRTVTATPSSTATATATRTVSPLATPTPSSTVSATLTASPTISPTATISPLVTATSTRTIEPITRLILLKGVYPNPFDEEAHVFFILKDPATVRMDVYNVAGEIIHRRSLALTAGPQVLDWDGRNQDGGRVASGVYITRVQAVSTAGDLDDFWMNVAAVR